MGDYIVRADFYPDGNILPLGITNKKGKTFFIRKIIEKKYISPNEYKFKCVADEKEFILVFKENKWLYFKI
ncbi:MAG: hypothetical protein E7524_00890 [Ruminococcaceae bacterium]|nr:hypothetical protein [Oscillospiraceae bacterium]